MTHDRRPAPPQLQDDTTSEESIGRLILTSWSTAVGRLLVRFARRLARSVSAHGVLYLTSLVGLVLVGSLTALGAAVYDAVSESDGISTLDRPTLQLALDHRSAGIDRGLTIFTHLGGPVGMTIIAVVITGLMVWRWRSRTPLVLMIVAVTGSLLITVLGKNEVGRHRPPQVDAVPPYETSPSFPSGHALNSTVIAGLVAYLILRRLHRQLARVLTIVVAVAWAIAIGLSRVFLGHHWLTDVMFGWVIGLAWLGVVITAHRLYLTVRGPREQPS
ncbi:MAG: phosphatase PAP2 family protein [Propionibacteriaceae bacterium]